MKKVILFVMMCVCALSAYALENAKCYLEHDGNVTTFDASKIADAIEAAVKGDILYLGEGQYPGFTLDKEITVRGAGADKTKVSNSVTVKIPGNPDLSCPIMIGLGINGNVFLNSTMNNLLLKQCHFNSFEVYYSNDNINIESCKIGGIVYMTDYIKKLTIKNSQISVIQASNTNYSDLGRNYTTNNISTYINCNILSLQNDGSGYLKGTFINCILRNYRYSNYFSQCIFTNSLLGWDIVLDATSSQQECYTDTKFTMDSNALECSYDTDALTSKGYLGNDGTVVGIYGGSNPYTLDLNLPRITTSKIALDRENKVLNVNLKVTKN